MFTLGSIISQCTCWGKTDGCLVAQWTEYTPTLTTSSSRFLPAPTGLGGSHTHTKHRTSPPGSAYANEDVGCTGCKKRQKTQLTSTDASLGSSMGKHNSGRSFACLCGRDFVSLHLHFWKYKTWNYHA